MNQLYGVMQSSDVVIGIGARFSLGNPAGEASTLVNINIDDADLTRHQANTIPLHGDARATIEALLPYLIEAGAGERPSPAEAVSAARKLIAYYDIRLKEPQYAVLESMQRGIPDDAFLVWDVTQFGYYARTHYQVNHPKTYIDSGYSFNLGYAFPTALGVKVAKPDRPVICMAGDGGFMFNSSELSTALQYGINVVTVVFRNDSYGNVARDLDDAFGGTYGTDLHNPDFVKFAESFGAVGMRASDPMELETLIPLALERQSPVISTCRSERCLYRERRNSRRFTSYPGPCPRRALYSLDTLVQVQGGQVRGPGREFDRKAAWRVVPVGGDRGGGRWLNFVFRYRSASSCSGRGRTDASTCYCTGSRRRGRSGRA